MSTVAGAPTERDGGGMAATALLAAAFGIAIAAFSYAMDPLAVLGSDKELQFIPFYYEIGRLLHSGEWPFLTTRTMQGGNFLSEYQFSVLNPVSLLSYYLLPYIKDVYLASALLNGFYLAILGAGTCLLARTYQLSNRACLVVAFALSANGYVIYWLASSWFVGLVSLAWAVWAMALARLLLAAPSVKVLAGFVVFSFLTVTAGFHFSDLGLGVFVLFQAVWLLRAGAASRAALLVLAFSAAVLLAAPSLLPLIFAVGDSLRPFGITASVDMQVPLSSLLTSSVPFVREAGMIFGSESFADPGQYHIGWFIAPALALFGLKTLVQRPELREALAITAMFLLLSQLPDRFFYLEYPLRLLPFLALFALIAGAGVAQHGDLHAFARKNGDRVLIWLWLVLFYLAVFKSNTDVRLLLASFVLIGLGSWHFLRCARADNRQALFGGILLVAMVIFGVQYAIAPTSFNMKNFKLAAGQSVLADGNGFPPFVLTLSDWTDADEVYRPAATWLLAGERSVAGYGHINPKALNVDACMNALGETCPGAARYFFSREAETGQLIADLLGVGRVIVRHGAAQDELRKVLPGGWVRRQGNARLSVYEKKTPPARRGTYAWASPSLAVVEMGNFREDEERLEIGSNTGAGLVVFSRVYFPGYRAHLNGQVLPVRIVAGYLTAVEVPAGATGELTLSYHYPRLPAALTAVVLGSLLFGACLLLARRIDRFPYSAAGG